MRITEKQIQHHPWHAELDRIIASYAGATSAPDPTHLEAQISAALLARSRAHLLADEKEAAA